MSAWTIYLILMLDGFKGVVATVSFVLAVLFFFVHTDFNESWDIVKVNTKAIVFVSLFIALGALMVFVPSTKQAAIIYVAPKVIQNERAQQIPEKLMDVFDKAVEDYLKE